MFCENPPESAEAVMPRRRNFQKAGICVKCKTIPGKLVIRHAIYCKACFLLVITSKFRQVLDPMINPSNRKPHVRGSLKASGNLMIGFSGGLGSTVLLDLVKACYFSPQDVATNKGGDKHPRKKEKAWSRVLVCYVECCEGHEGAVDRTDDIRSAMEMYRGLFDFLPLKLEDAFLGSDRNGVGVDLAREDLPLSANKHSGVSPVSLLRAHLSSLPTATSHQSTVSALIRLILQHTARTHGCSHLLFGTSLTSLSVNLIDAVANGAGYTLGMEMAEDWQSHDNGMVRVIRPLREISLKECAAYIHWRDLSVVGNTRILSASSNKASIGTLTKEFILGLERDYPSTVSTIVRTCNKLVSNTAGDRCVLCERPAQPGIREWKRRISIRNTNQDEPRSFHNELCGTDNADFSEGSAPLLISRLCYACHTSLTSRSSRGARKTADSGDGIHSVPLPSWVERNLSQPSSAKMKEHIQEYLLNTDGESNEGRQDSF